MQGIKIRSTLMTMSLETTDQFPGLNTGRRSNGDGPMFSPKNRHRVFQRSHITPAQLVLAHNVNTVKSLSIFCSNILWS